MAAAGAGHQWPDGARFAFTIFDDTDLTTLENGPPVYDLLTELGIRITKSVWPSAPAGPPLVGGSTCADPEYAAWVLDLQAAGHEIGYHNASDHPSQRDGTIAALDTFRELFGHDPRIGADHAGNLEAIYWGPRRLSGIRSWIYGKGSSVFWPDRGASLGHVEESPYFWADELRDRIDYWRNFTYATVDTLRACPDLPYHDPLRPYVNWWFASSHAPTLATFLDLVTPAALDRLEADGGACILYTHLGAGFAPDGKLDPRFEQTMRALADRPGWFAPTSDVLDHLRAQRGHDHPLSDRARARLETRWIVDQVRNRGIDEARRAVRRRRR